jgi:nucleoside-diphosphate-sugar epimerase
MKIVVIGGTGLIRSKLVEKLRAQGHAPLAAASDTGVDSSTGEGPTAVNGIVALGRPEQFRLDELARRVLRANNDARPVTAGAQGRA